MKRLLLVCLLSTFLMGACSKEREDSIQRVEINALVATGVAYRVDLKSYIKAKEFAVITRPPLNYRVSRLLYNGNISGPVYEFITDAHSGSTDRAIIKVVKEHEHNTLQLEHDEMDHAENDDYTSVIITLNFSIP